MRAATSAPVIWIEETGCWFAGPDGRPARAQGVVRINNERHAHDEQLMRLSRHDPLTGELNRTHLVASLAETIEETTRSRSSWVAGDVGSPPEHPASSKAPAISNNARRDVSLRERAAPRPARRSVLMPP